MTNDRRSLFLFLVPWRWNDCNELTFLRAREYYSESSPIHRLDWIVSRFSLRLSSRDFWSMHWPVPNLPVDDSSVTFARPKRETTLLLPGLFVFFSSLCSFLRLDRRSIWFVEEPEWSSIDCWESDLRWWSFAVSTSDKLRRSSLRSADSVSRRKESRSLSSSHVPKCEWLNTFRANVSSLSEGIFTFGETSLIISLRKRNLPISWWNLLPQLWTQTSSNSKVLNASCSWGDWILCEINRIAWWWPSGSAFTFEQNRFWRLGSALLCIGLVALTKQRRWDE